MATNSGTSNILSALLGALNSPEDMALVEAFGGFLVTLAAHNKQHLGTADATVAKVGTITKAQLKEIATKKLPDLNTDNIEAAMKVVAGSARSMGVDVK